MIPFSSSKCYFLPSFVWLFSKLSLYLLAFPQTLKEVWVASGYCRCPSCGPLVLPAVPTRLWCRSLIPCARGGLNFPVHIVHPGENKLQLCCQSKHRGDAAGADNGSNKCGRDHRPRRGGRERQANHIGVQWLRRIARLNWRMVEQKRSFHRGDGE